MYIKIAKGMVTYTWFSIAYLYSPTLAHACTEYVGGLLLYTWDSDNTLGVSLYTNS